MLVNLQTCAAHLANTLKTRRPSSARPSCKTANRLLWAEAHLEAAIDAVEAVQAGVAAQPQLPEGREGVQVVDLLPGSYAVGAQLQRFEAGEAWSACRLARASDLLHASARQPAARAAEQDHNSSSQSSATSAVLTLTQQ